MSEQDTQVTEDTGLSTETEPLEDDGVALEDMEINMDDSDESEPVEAATKTEEEESTPETDDGEAETKEESQDEPEEPAPAKEESTDSAAERKRFNDEMAKQRIAEREARQQAREAQQALEAERLQNYLAEAEGDDDEYNKRQLNIEAYKLQQEKAVLNTERLQVGIDKAIASIDLFRTGSPAVQEELLSALDDFERYNVVKDNAGNYMEVKGDVYQYLQRKAESIRRLTQEGAVSEAKSRSVTKAKTLQAPSRTPKQPKVDPEVDAFDEEANRW
jgi:hypothetical protein